MVNTNVLYCGDCLAILKGFPNDSVDLIYLDPPFFSNRHYEILWGNGAELRAFGDRWKGGINHYIDWMNERLEQCHRVLKKTGSIYLHCDWHASHYLKVAMDKIFDDGNFRNEIIWKRKTGRGETNQKSNRFGTSTDSILFYSKSNANLFHSQFNFEAQGYKEYVEKFFMFVDEKGRRYATDNLASPSPRPNLMYEYKGYKPPKNGWAISLEKMKEWDVEGKLIFPKNVKGRIRRKRYADELKGRPVQNLWDDIQPVSSQSSERLDYPTQKPEAILDRIIKTSSNANDIVLDPMMGGGTTLAVAQKLGRKWIGIDVSPVACKLAQKRLRQLGAKDVVILGLPNSISDLKKLPHFEFQNWVCKQLNGKISDKKSSDMGIDGWILGTIPIQVKQSDDVGRNHIDNFAWATSRAGKKRGVFVAFSYSKGAFEEVARAKLNNGIEIKLLTIEDMLKAQFNPMELF